MSYFTLALLASIPKEICLLSATRQNNSRAAFLAKGRASYSYGNGRHICRLILAFYREIVLQIYEPGEFEYDILGSSFIQDGAPSHASKWTMRKLKQEGILIHEHVGNSLDMNAIEKAWMPMRIAITRDWNRPHTIKWSDRAWRAE